MKKARIILAVTMLLAAVGGALAFKAMRNGRPTYTLTNQTILNGKIYQAASSTCLSVPCAFVTEVGPLLETWYTITSIAVPTTVITFTAIDGSGSTITLAVPRPHACIFDYTRVTCAN